MRYTRTKSWTEPWSASDGVEVLENFRKLGAERTENEEIEKKIFAQSKNKFDHLDVQKFVKTIQRSGLRLSDPRLLDVRTNVDNCQNFIIEHVDEENIDTSIDYDCFKGIIANNSELLTAAFDKQFVIADFESFQNDIRLIFNECWSNDAGELSEYTDILAAVNPDQWGVSICSVDGQRCGFGHNTKMFPLQAIVNPFVYAAVLGEIGHDKINKIVGQESSGCQYNTIRLDKNLRPHNPMINAGAILMSSEYRKDSSDSDRHNDIIRLMKRIAGLTEETDATVGFDYGGFMSERANCNRNASIAYFMREKNCFPDWETIEVNRILDVYTQMQNITVNCDSLSVMAATLANGGICPITGEAVLGNDDVKSSLSCMNAAGMNDYSGQWAYKIGLPAKSGISGGVVIVVPNVMGIAVFSPKIEKSYNSVRGLDFATRLVKTFHFHEFDPIRLRSKTVQQTTELLDEEKLIIILIAAQRNDVGRLTRAFLEDFDLNTAGYDNKTPLMVGATHGNMDVVSFLVSQVQVDISLKDKYGYTAADLAEKCGHKTIHQYLVSYVNIKTDKTTKEDSDLPNFLPTAIDS